MPFCANFAKIYPNKVHIAVNKSHEGINRQKFKYRRVAFGEKTLATALTWLLGKSWLIEYKWHEERGLILKIKVTSGYFCGQEMLSYVVNTKISHKFDFRNFRFFWFPWGPTTLSNTETGFISYNLWVMVMICMSSMYFTEITEDIFSRNFTSENFSGCGCTHPI